MTNETENTPAFIETQMAATVANARTAWQGFTTARQTFRLRLVCLMVGYVAANHEADAKLASKYVAELFGDDAKVSTFANYRSKVRTFLAQDGIVAHIRKEIGEPSLLTSQQFTDAVSAVAANCNVDWGDAKAKTKAEPKAETPNAEPEPEGEGEPQDATMTTATAAMVAATALDALCAEAVREPGGVAHMALRTLLDRAKVDLAKADAAKAEADAMSAAKERAKAARAAKRAALKAAA